MTEFVTKYLCPFCNAKIRAELFNSTYGCETGCEYVNVEVECPECKKVVWSSGTFGYYETEQEEAEYRDDFMQDFAEALDQIIKEKGFPTPESEGEKTRS